MARTRAWTVDFEEPPSVQGIRHNPKGSATAGIILTHGAGGDADSPLLVALCEVFAENAWTAVRCNLPYRQKRPKGPPSLSGSVLDRRGLERAVEALRAEIGCPIFIGGSSYGGRQASILLSEQPQSADGLLLLSYPLHPPGKPERLRTEHLSGITVPTLFAHGAKDTFGSVEEMQAARKLLIGPTALEVFDGATHGIVQKRHGSDHVREVAERIVERFLALMASSGAL